MCKTFCSLLVVISLRFMVRRSTDDKLVPDVVTLPDPIGINDTQSGRTKNSGIDFRCWQHGLRRLRVPHSMRSMRQGAGGSTARHGLHDAGATERELIARPLALRWRGLQSR
jgi:hypothetical protein